MPDYSDMAESLRRQERRHPNKWLIYLLAWSVCTGLAVFALRIAFP